MGNYWDNLTGIDMLLSLILSTDSAIDFAVSQNARVFSK